MHIFHGETNWPGLLFQATAAACMQDKAMHEQMSNGGAARKQQILSSKVRPSEQLEVQGHLELQSRFAPHRIFLPCHICNRSA